MEAIRTEKLTKYYGRARGIIDVDLTIEKGEYFGFIGPNGAGKSTTIRTLLGFIFPTSGRAEVLGHDVVKEKEDILRKTGYLPSEAIFYSGMRARDVIKMSADLRKQDCANEAARLCERLQLDTSLKVGALSFGNRKKLAIVCALQSMPELIVLDEPTGGLDPLMQKEFFDILKERNADGATVLLSSHVLPEIQRNCAKAAVIREGRIVACESVDNLSRTAAKRITVHGFFDLNGLDGVRDFKAEDGAVSFLYSGDVNLLLKRLADGDIRDLDISQPDLGEVFYHFYEKGGDRI